jgi:hypothetical protein
MGERWPIASNGRLDRKDIYTLVWKDKAGRIRVKLGMPRLSQLPAITGLPAQKIDDPELADFR